VKKNAGIALLALAVVLLVFGLDASRAFGSDVSRLFQGWPADRTEWFYIVSAGVGVLGLDLLFSFRTRHA